MPAIVSDVELCSIADEINIEAGDEILAIDGNKLLDLIDYNFYCKTEFLTLSIKKANGELEDIEIEKDFDEQLGIIFESAVFDKIKPCLNKCIFCFVDQQPEGLRDTLYIKDDDYRLSYLQGTYITLTNLKDEDKARISKMHLGPLYVSVHTTNPDLRVEMLKNPNAKNIMANLKWLESQEIPIHCQIVLCPDYNDGIELERTLKDLKSLKNVLSVAIVPVGLTQFRKKELKKVDKKIAEETLKIASKYKGVCCSDEFFLLAEQDIPPAKYYGNFSQLSDGVGSLRLLIDDFKKQKLPKSIKHNTKIIFATSYAAKSAIEFVCNELSTKVKNLTCECLPVKSTYWGDNITVAGLITSDDLINSLKDKSADIVIIPSIMLKPFSEKFLDGNNLNYVKDKTKLNFFVVNNSNSTKEIIEYLKTI